MDYIKLVSGLSVITAFYIYFLVSPLSVLPPSKQGYFSNITLDTQFIKNSVTDQLNKNPAHVVFSKNPYHLENPILCTAVSNLKVLIIVHTAPNHFIRRKAIRETWTNKLFYPNVEYVRVLFLLGAVNDMSLQAAIVNEFNTHVDILQGNFLDSYHNLTYKGIMAYRWLTEKCRNAKVILKVDDDVIVDMPFFLSTYMPVLLRKKKYVVCRRFHQGKISRDPGSKWYVHNSIFKNQTFYPDYCQGIVVIIANDLIPIMFEFTKRTPFFWIDDVYLYGLVPRNIFGIEYIDLIFKKDVVHGLENAVKCYKDEGENCQLLAAMFRQNITSSMKHIWGLIINSRSVVQSIDN